MIEEVRRQFRDIPELKSALAILNKEKDESKWSKKDRDTYELGLTKVGSRPPQGRDFHSSLIKEMVAPGLLAVITPVVFGFGAHVGRI